MGRTLFLAGLCGLVLCSRGAYAAEAGEGGILTFLVENDYFTDTDRYYTSGIKLDYLTPSSFPDPVRNLLQNTVWSGGKDAVMRTQFSIGQNLYTPSDIRIAVPQPNDRPYAAWLYASYGIIAEWPDTVTNLDLEIGVVGPDAGGKWAQTKAHEWFGGRTPRGWDLQVENRFGADLTLERTWRRFELPAVLGVSAKIEPGIGATVGNVLDEAYVGATLRIGTDLGESTLPLRVRPSLAGSGIYDTTDGVGWYIFAGGTGSAVAYNYLLEGKTPYSSNVEKNDFVGDLQFGAVLRLGRCQLATSYIIRSEEFKQQGVNDSFGAASISWHF